MIRNIICLLFIVLGQGVFGQSVGINNTGQQPDGSAIFDVSSTQKGMLIPRMTSQQRDNISNPAEGLLVYDLDTGSFWYRHMTDWVELDNMAPLENHNNLIREKNINNTKFILNQSEIPQNGQSTSGSMMYFNPSKASFRGGLLASSDYWSQDSLGDYSFYFLSAAHVRDIHR